MDILEEVLIRVKEIGFCFYSPVVGVSYDSCIRFAKYNDLNMYDIKNPIDLEHLILFSYKMIMELVN